MIVRAQSGYWMNECTKHLKQCTSGHFQCPWWMGWWGRRQGNGFELGCWFFFFFFPNSSQVNDLLGAIYSLSFISPIFNPSPYLGLAFSWGRFLRSENPQKNKATCGPLIPVWVLLCALFSHLMCYSLAMGAGGACHPSLPLSIFWGRAIRKFIQGPSNPDQTNDR